MATRNVVHGGRTYPAEGEVFSLVPEGGGPPREFKLVLVPECRNLEEVRERIAEHGNGTLAEEIPWVVAFFEAYPISDGKTPIALLDLSWVDPRKHAHLHLPGVWSGEQLGSVLHRFVAARRWLVAVGE
ncbi:MAG: hypothetical protein Q8R20_02820 [Nanoarchaeota archaeon]|nr:hypothetical protein [Nanoarchaeota archaeon]